MRMYSEQAADEPQCGARSMACAFSEVGEVELGWRAQLRDRYIREHKSCEGTRQVVVRDETRKAIALTSFQCEAEQLVVISQDLMRSCATVALTAALCLHSDDQRRLH